ncbi:hypothetical protein MWU54_05810 [Marivita sp. S6314]|uniref:hypothetical protein n=1 Tax=Marivita sp. S6314 TaxID=2926406 RepID=UPI001FF23B0F|nr:hypothetical protein [Marivita sp. S6314]MCK0149529.1 hypothetical protein [Marivita sp. S6314]
MLQLIISSRLQTLFFATFVSLNANFAYAQSTFGLCDTPSVEDFNAKAPISSSKDRISNIAKAKFRQLSGAPRITNTAFKEAQSRANRGSISISAGDLLTSVGEGASVFNESRPTSSSNTQPQSTGRAQNCECDSGDLRDCSYELSGIQEPICY